MAEPAQEANEQLNVVPYVVAIDVGTTTIRSHIYKKQGTIKGTSSRRIELIHPKPGWTEMDPQLVYQQVVDCVSESIQAAGITVDDVTCMGISVQRNTFLTWDRETGKPFHNFVTWQDLRASNYVKSWNHSFSLKMLNNASKVIHAVTRVKKYLSASILKFISPQVTLRLSWCLDNIENLRNRASENMAMFGCLDTWLVWKLTGGAVHATDYSCASSTGIFDPFELCWSSILSSMVNIPLSILPEVRPTSGDFGYTDSAIFGTEIPITCVVGDQSASMFGECCFDVGDIKCTLGTGMFIDVNTGSKPHASIAGLYPLIAWKIGDKVTYMAEGIASDNGTTLTWAQSLGMFDDVSNTSQIAESVPDTNGVYFVPAFSGLQAPINDDKAVTMMIGMTPLTSRAHIVRAILESIAFRFKLLYETVLQETNISLSHIRVDGGVSNNDFVVQLLADLTNQTVNRPKQTDSITSLGTAFLAGLAMGVWKDHDELKMIRLTERKFHSQPTWTKYKHVFHQWERAVNRSRQWYPKHD